MLPSWCFSLPSPSACSHTPVLRLLSQGPFGGGRGGSPCLLLLRPGRVPEQPLARGVLNSRSRGVSVPLGSALPGLEIRARAGGQCWDVFPWGGLCLTFNTPLSPGEEAISVAHRPAATSALFSFPLPSFSLPPPLASTLASPPHFSSPTLPQCRPRLRF